MQIKNKICDIIKEKATNVVLSADLTDKRKLIDLLDKTKEYILGVKLHSDIIDDFYGVKDGYTTFIDDIKQMASDYNFIIIEDRKFADIGNTVNYQSKFITSYADLVTVHSLPGYGVLDGLMENCKKNNCGVLLLAQMSSKGNLITPEYAQKTIEMAKDYEDIVVGFICQEKLTNNFLHFTPGVQLHNKNDNLGQQYNTPQYVIDEKKSDILIVGRGIYMSQNPTETIKQYIHLPK